MLGFFVITSSMVITKGVLGQDSKVSNDIYMNFRKKNILGVLLGGFGGGGLRGNLLGNK